MRNVKVAITTRIGYSSLSVGKLAVGQCTMRSGEAVQYLCDADPVLSRVIKVVGTINTTYREPNFEAFVRIVINQQLSDKAASTIYGRIRSSLGGDVTPKSVVKSNPQNLLKCGISRQKLMSIIGIAEKFLAKPNFLQKLERLGNDEAVQELTSLRGIGVWSASIFLLFCLRRPDIFPEGDVSLEKAINSIYPNIGVRDEAIIAWSPHKSTAALHLWAWIDMGMPKY
jgi:DNA-3-methyladenine glycosylase II